MCYAKAEQVPRLASGEQPPHTPTAFGRDSLASTIQPSLFAEEQAQPPWEVDDESDRLFAEIVFNRPMEELFLYEVPYPLRDRIGPGKRVVAPFGRGNQEVVGYCVGLRTRVNRADLKSVIDVVDDEALLNPAMLELASWIAQHYLCSVGQVLDCMLPAGVRGGAGTRAVTVLRLSPALQNRENPATIDTLQEVTAKQRRILKLLADAPDGLSSQELARRTPCGQSPIRSLQVRGLVVSTRERAMSGTAPELPSEPAPPFEPNPDQVAVLEQVTQAIDHGGFHGLLLHGVTGSGKTEVYLRAIERVVEQGRQAIVLVPEISLTPQTIRRFRSRFSRVAVLHSHLADAERHLQWRLIVTGNVQVVVGARSAVFAPTPKLGLLVIDEEHETTFKQDQTPRYHARDVGVRRAEIERVPILLGSATPSLESWNRAATGSFQLLPLPSRVLNRPLPDVRVVDLRNEQNLIRQRGALSAPLVNAMRLALQAGGQVILLLNRRGFSTHLHCWHCGNVVKCRHCDISLVYHRKRSAAVCHFCDFEMPPPQHCPQCQHPGVSYQGLGTERLEQEVRARCPGYELARMDTDTMRGRGSHERVLAAFRDGHIRILLGTQMIAKGLDFPGVTLVGVVNADTAMHLPDFRASERTFQLVAQVAGRTGRGDRGGYVLVQTFSPEHSAIQAAVRHDYDAFVRSELSQRRAHGYPPFGRLVRVIVRSPEEEAASAYIHTLAARLRAASPTDTTHGIRVLGPAPAPVYRLKDKYRFHMQLQAADDLPLRELLRPILAACVPPNRVELALDVDPVSML